VLLLALLNAVYEIVELNSLLVVDAHELLGSRLQNFADASQGRLDLNVKVELGTVVFATSLHLPNLKLGAVEAGSHNVAGVGLALAAFASKQVAGLFKLDNGRKTHLRLSMGFEVFGDRICFNVPHLNLTVLSSNAQEIFIYLEKASGAQVVFVSLLEGTLACLELDFTDNSEAFSPVGAAHHSARAELKALPLHFNHSVVNGGLRAANKNRCHRTHWLSFLGLLLGFLFLHGGSFFLFFFNFVSIFVELLFLFDDDNNLRLWRRGLKGSEGLLIGINVEQWEKALGVVSRRPNVDVTFDASRGEILVLKFAEVHDLNDGLGMGQLEDVELILLF
jgi:hypothetical protein